MSQRGYGDALVVGDSGRCECFGWARPMSQRGYGDDWA